MATGQTLLDTMELLNQELQLQSGENDVTRGLVALNRAQDFFEARAAIYPDILGGSTGTVVTASSTETTAFPTGVLRVDGLQVLDSNSRPIYNLDPIEETGGHVWNRYWPLSAFSTVSAGRPRAYWDDGTNIYWDPLPDAVYTIRWYGFKVKDDITAGGTFNYPDVVILPIASFAVRLIKTGIDDMPADVGRLAQEVFDPVLDTMSMHKRERPKGFVYRYTHDT